MSVTQYMSLFRMLARKARMTLRHMSVHGTPHPEPQTTVEAEKHQWPLFERMRISALKTMPRNGLRAIHPGADADVPVCTIPSDDFTAARLMAEIYGLPGAGGEIHLPPQRIELTEGLRLRSGVRLVGVQRATELVFKNVDYGIVIAGDDTSAVSRVKVANLRIRHEGAHKFCSAVFVTGAADLLFSNIEIIAPRAVGFLLSDGVCRARFERCSVYHAGLVGFMMIRDVQDTILDSCIAENCQQSGVFLTDIKLLAGMGPLDFDAQIHHTNSVIGNYGPFAPEDPSPCRTTFMNCAFRRNRKMGITTDGVGYMRVINCVIAENDCEGITIDNGSWGCQVQNCHIYNNGWRGLQMETELNGDFVKKFGVMQDGSSKAKLPGVSLDNAAYCRIEDNCIEGNWGDGVKFVRSVYSCTVARNIISDNNRGINDAFHYFGVLLGVAQRQHPEQYDFPSCFNRVIENDILGPHFAGVHLVHGTRGNLVQNNRIIGSTFVAVEDHTTTGNSIRENGPEVTGGQMNNA